MTESSERRIEGALFGAVVPGSVRPVDESTRTYRWETTTSAVVTSGELTQAQEQELHRDGDVRFVGYGEPPCKAYSQFWFVEATSAWDALQEAADRLDSLLKPYGVEYMLYHSSAHAQRNKIVQVRMPG